jgi:hypothetical protein
MMIVNDDSGIVTELDTSLTDDARVIIYDHHMFIVQATGLIFESKGTALRHDTQHNDIQYNDNHHNGPVCDTQHE